MFENHDLFVGYDCCAALRRLRFGPFACCYLPRLGSVYVIDVSPLLLVAGNNLGIGFPLRSRLVLVRVVRICDDLASNCCCFMILKRVCEFRFGIDGNWGPIE